MVKAFRADVIGFLASYLTPAPRFRVIDSSQVRRTA